MANGGNERGGIHRFHRLTQITGSEERGLADSSTAQLLSRYLTCVNL